ncbi:MAG TPA: hypothetical protein PLM79_13770 [Syntrophobacteraceae bacterium]|mgnify:CR=1 FL=1|nr:hypothetical protein [Syntrophobacteraceae bacterium]HQI25269.1 hypothetical protein [Smithella sp.]
MVETNHPNPENQAVADSEKPSEELITRKEAFKKMGKYAAYSAAVVAVLLSSPDKAVASPL